MAEKLQELEIRIATGSLDNFEFDCLKNGIDTFPTSEDIARNDKKLLNLIANGVLKAEYSSVLNLDLAEIFFKKETVENFVCDDKEVVQHLTNVIKQEISVNDEKFCTFQVNVLLLGISALQEFIKLNWTGPSNCETGNYQFVSKILNSAKISPKNIINLLFDYDVPNTTYLKHPELLLLSKIFISSVTSNACVTRNWWMLRYLMIYQQIVPEKNFTLFTKMKELVADILRMEWIAKDENQNGKIQFLVEAGQMHLCYHEIIPARKYFTEAKEILDLDIELSGAYGKRTQFQQNAVPQLFVKFKKLSLSPKTSITLEKAACGIPCDLLLKDDVLLNEVKFIDNDGGTVNNLHPEEQIVLLAHCCLVQKSSASDELLQEQVMAYIECLLAQPNIWSVHVKTLIMRCKIEKNRSRKVERAMMQIEALLDAITKKDIPDVSVRQYMFYGCLFPPQWILEKELADLLISLGATKSALDIYQRLEMWEDIVTCYQILDRNDKAADIVRVQIAKNKTPILWCLLGDVTNDPECYHKAWELSNHKNARSQRSLGNFYYKKREYSTCIPFFTTALEINHLQLKVWFALGFAASQINDHKSAAQAYRHVVNLDPDNFEAWNNLSNSYIKLKEKVRAFRTLQEALKCNYEDWRVWENFLLVSIDIGAFEEAIQAWHRLLDIKGKHDDSEILGIIVKAITNDLVDFGGQPAARLMKKALQLFGRITSITTNNSSIWKLYALLYSSDPEYRNSKEIAQRVLQYAQKAHRVTIQQLHWEKELLSCKTVITVAMELADAYLVYIKLADDIEKLQTKTSAKLMLRSVITQIEKQLQDFHSVEAEELQLLLKSLHDKLVEISTV